MKFNVIARAGLSQQQFAELVGVSRVTVNTWITGKHRPAPHIRHRVATTLQYLAEAVKNNNLPISHETYRKDKAQKLKQIRARVDVAMSHTLAGG